MGTIHVPTLLEGILEATAAEAAAKARITTLRAALEDEARRRFAVEGAAPSWTTPQLGKVRLDPAGDWTATVADEAAFGSYVAEHHPTEATVAIYVKAEDAADVVQALEFIQVTPVEARVEVRPAWREPYLKGLALDVTEERDDSAQVTRTVVAADTTTGAVVPGIGVTRSEAKLVVSLDRDRRTAAITQARTTASALVEAAAGEDDEPVDLAELDRRRVELEGLHADQLATIAGSHGLGRSGTKAALAERIARAELATGNVVRPASTLDPAGVKCNACRLNDTVVNGACVKCGAADEVLVSSPLPEGTEVEEVSEVPSEDAPEPGPGPFTDEEGNAYPPTLTVVRDVEEEAELDRTLAEVEAAPELTVEDLNNAPAVALAKRLDGLSREVLRQHAKAIGLSAAGSKPDVITRLVEAGVTVSAVNETAARSRS